MPVNGPVHVWVGGQPSLPVNATSTGIRSDFEPRLQPHPPLDLWLRIGDEWSQPEVMLAQYTQSHETGLKWQRVAIPAGNRRGCDHRGLAQRTGSGLCLQDDRRPDGAAIPALATTLDYRKHATESAVYRKAIVAGAMIGSGIGAEVEHRRALRCYQVVFDYGNTLVMAAGGMAEAQARSLMEATANSLTRI